MRTRRLLVSVIAAALVVTVILVADSGPRHERVRKDLVPQHVASVFADNHAGDNPLGLGGEISMDDLQRVTEGCGVCTLPETGPLGMGSVAHAWYRSDDIVAIRFADGLEIYFEADTRTNDEYLSDTRDLLEESNLYSFIQLRGLTVLAHGYGGSEFSPANLAWIEDGHRVAIIGHGGQELSALVAAATQLGT